MQDCMSPALCEEVQWRAKQESRLRFGDDPGLVLGQPLFNSHRRLILIGAEPLDLALAPQAAPLQTDNIGSSQAALIVLSAESLEPVCKVPSENAIVELKWLRPDAMLLVGSGSMLHLVDCTTQENVQDWFASTALVADYGRGALIRDFTFNRHNDLMLTGGQDGLCRVSAFADGSVLAPMREIALGGTISSVRWRPSSAVSESGAGSDCSLTLESGGFEMLDVRKADPRVFRYIQPERLYTHAYDEPNDFHVMLAGAKGRITVLDLRKPTTACKQMVIADPELSDIGSLSKSPLGQAVWCVAGTPGCSLWDLSATSTLLWHQHLLHHDITGLSLPSLTYAAFSDYGDLAITTSTGHVAVFDEQMLRREHLGTIAASTSHQQQVPCEPNLPTPIVTVREGFRRENARPPRYSRKVARP